MNTSATVLLQHRPYGSAKLSHAKSSDMTNRASLRYVRPAAVGLDTGRVKAGETRGSSVR